MAALGRKKPIKKISKVDIGLEINRAFVDNDMEKLFKVIATYMYLAELTVSSETIMRMSEDGLIKPCYSSNSKQWLFKSKDDEE